MTTANRLVHFAHDITERKRAEEALMRRTDDLIQQSEELEAARDEANTKASSGGGRGGPADHLRVFLAGETPLSSVRFRESPICIFEPLWPLSIKKISGFA